MKTKIDYLQVSSKAINLDMFDSFLNHYSKIKQSRFYRDNRFFDDSEKYVFISASPYTNKTPPFSVRFSQVGLYYLSILEPDVILFPEFAKISRLDIAFDYYMIDNRDYLKLCSIVDLLGVPTMKYESDTITYYYGDRKSKLFVRLYEKQDDTGYYIRFEIEFKPDSRNDASKCLSNLNIFLDRFDRYIGNEYNEILANVLLLFGHIPDDNLIFDYSIKYSSLINTYISFMNQNIYVSVKSLLDNICSDFSSMEYLYKSIQMLREKKILKLKDLDLYIFDRDTQKHLQQVREYMLLRPRDYQKEIEAESERIRDIFIEHGVYVPF